MGVGVGGERGGQGAGAVGGGHTRPIRPQLIKVVTSPMILQVRVSGHLPGCPAAGCGCCGLQRPKSSSIGVGALIRPRQSLYMASYSMDQ